LQAFRLEKLPRCEPRLVENRNARLIFEDIPE